MIDIKIISLDKDIERRFKLENNLKQYNLHGDFISAIDGRKLSAIDYFKMSKNSDYFFDRKSYLTPSELGCFLSHKKALSEFVENSQANWLLVLEDDVFFDEELSIFINKREDSLCTNNLYILGGQNGLASFNRVFFTKKTKDKPYMMKASFGTHRWLYRTCCYLIHRKNAKDMISLMEKNTYVVDNWNYVLKNTDLNSIWFCNVISHPEDIISSNIQEERDLSKL
ncbi:glycosyltransferase family 25 protein [Photobacterium damselae]|uniref:glycosyltransferase family 25 protein n=1 Tax=Photobacterium damselae TaxID=38293 RepID=UPI0012464C81|nr:glycosyltransferase family 25 protein [Photobacterium damselae]KAB1182953.1 glycosyltransferase family 25 protein [Photobacterium damselae subsp. damselae]MBF7101604.1 glycosyltransferase family 25 protein [Photobacterium damselae]